MGSDDDHLLSFIPATKRSSSHIHWQMVFYIEACESGSMMTDLPADIEGELNFAFCLMN